MAVNVSDCEKCLHHEVCGIKAEYERYAQAADKLSICKGNMLCFANNNEDIIIEVKCKHFKLNSYMTIKSDSISIGYPDGSVLCSES